MDFKSLINKLDNIEAPPETPSAPKLPEKIRLNEDAELRVLAGTSTILAEAAIMEKKLTKAEKAKKEKVVKSMEKDKAGFKKRYGKRGEEVMHATATKIAKKKAESRESDHKSLSEAGLDINLIKAAQGHTSSVPKDSKSDRNISKPYGSRGSGRGNEKPMHSTDTEIRDHVRDKAEYVLASKVRKIEDIDEYIVPLIYDNNRDMDDDDFELVAEKLIKMAQEEDLSDPSRQFYNAVGDAVVEPYKFLKMKKPTDESFDKNRFRDKFLALVEAKKKETGKKSIIGKKAEEKMDEGKKSTKKKPDDDGDGVPDWADKKPGEDDHANNKKSASKGLSSKQKKLPPGLQKAIAAKKGKKKTVKESVEPKLSFRDMMRLVVESGGQQQIDPLDKELFAWATRVAQNKLGEGMKSEVYAGTIYERMGGRFDMYDVLSENQK